MSRDSSGDSLVRCLCFDTSMLIWASLLVPQTSWLSPFWRIVRDNRRPFLCKGPQACQGVAGHCILQHVRQNHPCDLRLQRIESHFLLAPPCSRDANHLCYGSYFVETVPMLTSCAARWAFGCLLGCLLLSFLIPWIIGLFFFLDVPWQDLCAGVLAAESFTPLLTLFGPKALGYFDTDLILMHCWSLPRNCNLAMSGFLYILLCCVVRRNRACHPSHISAWSFLHNRCCNALGAPSNVAIWRKVSPFLIFRTNLNMPFWTLGGDFR